MTKPTAEHAVYGFHAVHAALKQARRLVHALYLNQTRHDKRMDALIALAEQRSIPVHYLAAGVMKQRFPEATHQGVIADVGPPPVYTEADLDSILSEHPATVSILILDGVTDPHNLGACLRSADAAGVHCVITPKDNSARITPVVSKVASGAAESVPLIQVTNLARTLDKLKQAGVWLFGAAGEASKTLYAIDFTGPIAIVLGAEGTGLRRLTRDHCDALFSLPMYGNVSSLNVSVATGICLYEVVRQRHFHPIA
jgi:23S rRNA (guanosine2251-2'-O)-methyltransferase